MRSLSLALIALLVEVGWLALWPLSVALTHSTAFTTGYLEAHPFLTPIVDASLALTRPLNPALPTSPLGEPPGELFRAPAWALVGVLVFVGVAYLTGIFALDRGLGTPRSAVWLVLGAAVIFQATLAFLPGLFSQDVFSYIAYGRLAATYDVNPYVWPPSAVSQDIVLPWVAAIWRSYPVPYGPVWVDVQWAMSRLFGSLSPVDQALLYRLLANLLLLVNLGLLWRVLGKLTPLNRTQRTTALAVLAWNPLVLFELAANAHNDVLMVSFSLLAVLLLIRTRSGLAPGVSFTLGALVKYLSGVGLVWLAVATAARAKTMRYRTVAVVVLGAVCAGVVALMALPWLELPDSLEPLLAETTNVGYVNSLPDSLASAVAKRVIVPYGISLNSALETMRGFERVLTITVFLIYLAWEARRVWACRGPYSIVSATARSTLVYVLVVSTSLHPWYFCVPVALVAGLGWRDTLTRVTIGYSLLAPPALYLAYYLRGGTPFAVSLMYGLLPLLPLVGQLRPVRMLADRLTIVPGRA